MGALSRIRLVSRLYRAVLAAILVAVPGLAFADSSFRGFTVSDSPEKVEQTAKRQGYDLKWDDGDATILDQGKPCAWIRFDGDKKIIKMTFSACFFNAEGVGLREVTQGFVDKFGGSAEMEMKSDFFCKDAQPFAFKGRTSEGELFRIEDDCGVSVKMEPGSGKAMKF